MTLCVSPREAGSSYRKQLACRNTRVCVRVCVRTTLEQRNSSDYGNSDPHLPNPPTPRKEKDIEKKLSF